HRRARHRRASRAEGRVPALRDGPRLFSVPLRRRRGRGRHVDGGARARPRPERRGALVLIRRLAALALVPALLLADEPPALNAERPEEARPPSIWDGGYTGAPAGDSELPADSAALAGIRIRKAPGR